MPSGRRRSPPEAAPTFFLDRGLGRRVVPPVLHEAGLAVVVMADLYPDGADQRVPDPQWIADVSDRGWVALTKDVSIVRDHAAALRASTLRAFALDNANLRGDDMAERFRHHLHRILRRARKPGPYVDVLHRDRIERRWP